MADRIVSCPVGVDRVRFSIRMQTPFDKASSVLYRPVLLARVFFVLLTTLLGARLAMSYDVPKNPILFSSIGLALAVVIVIIEYATKAVSSRKILLAAVGLMLGLIFSSFFYPTIPKQLIDAETSLFMCNMMFGYFGVVLALRHSDWLNLGNMKFFLVNPAEHPKILDSSVIIDGRINDVIALGILRGPIIVPNFVLLEIQGIADSSIPVRRARGRRGLDVLEHLHKNCKTLDIVDTDFPDQPAVDQKLIQLCRSMTADLVTNDYNLQKIAELHQIAVLNLNELADAMRPAVYIGEAFDLHIVKHGKEPDQGVGYLEDGTMIVVQNAGSLVGEDHEIVVNNILQNPSGRLIFAKLREEEDEGRLHA